MCLLSKKESKKVKRILCYGDSLTAGYFHFGSEFHPYGNMLASLGDVYVKSIGMSGWTTDQMVQAADTSHNVDVVEFEAAGLINLLKAEDFDLVCLMAGTNDLGIGSDVADIIENLKTMLLMCLHTGSPHLKVVLMSIPASGGESLFESVRTRRAAVNAAIINIARKHVGRVIFIDGASVLVNPGEHPSTPTYESEAWDVDLLHLSPKGSERLGTHVYDSLVKCSLI